MVPRTELLRVHPEFEALEQRLLLSTGQVIAPPASYDIEFSLDIGSDCELSDPQVDGDEGFDPGDFYVWKGPDVDAANGGRDGLRDDGFALGTDIWPDPPDLFGTTTVPISSGGIENYPRYLDADGQDTLTTWLGEYIPRDFPLDTPLEEAQLQENLVYGPENLLISYDDDGDPGWPDLDIPTSVPSPGGALYGSTAGADEALALTVNAGPGSATLASLAPFASETDLHASLAPNPDTDEGEDDDVDSLDAVPGDPEGYVYFSVDHEANGGKDPGTIYAVDSYNPGTTIPIIAADTHLGLSPGTDIDAFEFVWLEVQPLPTGGPTPPQANRILALLFSVDGDDPLTANVDESGGLDPRALYASHMDGIHFEYLPGADLGDDVDALAAWSDAFDAPELKWDQPPTPVYYGWNQESTFSTEPGSSFIVDDWVCEGAEPVTEITWWGSYLGWMQPTPPPDAPMSFHLEIYEDMGEGGPGSSPVWMEDTGGAVEVEYVGADYDPRTGLYETCFEFSYELGEPFWQADAGPATWWLGIGAAYEVPPQYAWGWKTLPNDGRTEWAYDMGTGMQLEWDGMGWDVAFELAGQADTGGEPKHVQPFDRHEGAQPSYAWEEPGDPEPVYRYIQAADDWVCQGGDVTELVWWGTYENNERSDGLDGFMVEFYQTHAGGTYELPGAYLDYRYLTMGDISELPTGVQNVDGEDVYFYFADLAEPFQQTAGETYWLSITAQPLIPDMPERWQWQEADNAAGAILNAAAGRDDVVDWATIWENDEPHNLAFEVHSASEPQEPTVKWSQPPAANPGEFVAWDEQSIYGGYQVVADDWICNSDLPVTDIHWWGSFEGWDDMALPPEPPSAFHFAIWTNAEPGGGPPFSHPDQVVWEHTCTDWTAQFVGFEYDPRDGLVDEAMFYFEQDLPQPFFQDPGENIYWLSIAAMYDDPQNVSNPWGWATTTHEADSPLEDANIVWAPVIPEVGGDPWMEGGVVEWEGVSFDTAFQLTTGEVGQTFDFDFGDAPDGSGANFPTLLAGDGARHDLRPGGPYMSFDDIPPDAEPDGWQSWDALGDDNHDVWDEDGVLLPEMYRGQTGTVTVAARPGLSTGFLYLDAWIDWNGDLDWDDPGEKVHSTLDGPIGAGDYSFDVAVPPDALSESVFSRFRIHSEPEDVGSMELAPAGEAPNGEVEDHQVFLSDPFVEIDHFLYSRASLTLGLPGGGTELVRMVGPSRMDVEFDGDEGVAYDDDGDGLDEVVARLTSMDFYGNSSLGPVHLTLNEEHVSLGEIEEQVNNAPGMLDIPPFGVGQADSFFDVFYQIDIGGTVLHNEVPARISTAITSKPPADDETYADLDGLDIPLYDEDGNPSGLSLAGETYTPHPSSEQDLFPNTRAAVQITWPDDTTERIGLGGTSEWRVRVGTAGEAADADADGLDEVLAEIVGLGLAGIGSTGPVTVTLNPAFLSAGEMEEQVNAVAGTLDVPPFSTGHVDSFFDVFFEIEVPDVGTLHNIDPLLLETVLHHKPPLDGETYAVVGGPVELYDESGTATDVWVSGGDYAPDPVDYGDAPDAYPTLLAQNGARHHIVPGFALGSLADREPDGQPEPLALGDDNLDGADDEDGVVFTSPILPGQIATFDVSLTNLDGRDAFLDVWIDIDRNNSWAEPADHVLISEPLVDGVNHLTVPIPPSANPGETFARFRLSSTGDLPPDGPAEDGEVEDYAVGIAMDYGDAPEQGWGYPTTWARNGARHATIGPWLGELRDADADGQPNPDASGDDADPDGDDEDGVVIPGLQQGRPDTIRVTVSGGGGQVYAWIDYDGDGVWGSTAEEQVFSGYMGDGTHGFTVTPPSGSVTGQTFARVRIVSQGVVGPDGPADSGEVEDYPVSIEPAGQGLDYGDAPDGSVGSGYGYPTVFADDGARHVIGGPWLGDDNDAPDIEPDGQPDIGAYGDDADITQAIANDDEDGVSIPAEMLGAPVEVTVQVNSLDGSGGVVEAWIDWDHSGSWEPDEQIFSGPLANGQHTFPGHPTADVVGGLTYARVRISSAGGLAPTGEAADGEVEDHLVFLHELPADAKWAQWPDLTTNGIDVNLSNRVLADDFECRETSLLTDVHLWGSWLGDQVGEILGVTLKVYEDDPVGPGGVNPDNEYSMPGEWLWTGLFTNVEMHPYFTLPGEGEYWWDPRTGELLPDADNTVWQLDIDIDPAEAFRQTGTPESPKIYWLKATVETELGQFGWKTRRWPDHYMDDAVWDDPAAGQWQEMRYPAGHPYHGLENDSLDLAFLLTFDEAPDPDFGDAPEDGTLYPTTLARNGARHAVVPGYHMGGLIDAEPDGQPSADALGDDNNPSTADDEDGVTIPVLTAGNAADIQIAVTDVPGMGGFLNAWIDFNADGDWDEANEQVLVNALPGTGPYTIQVPGGAAVGDTYARVRLSTVRGPGYDGAAPDGEVEDYLVTIEEPTPADDLGDAPDSTNHLGASMNAYPGTTASFPTAYYVTSPDSVGPIHWDARDTAFLGVNVTGEQMADMGLDEDPRNNIEPVGNVPDLDGADDGVGPGLISLTHGEMNTFDFRATFVSPAQGYVNVWFDFNRDGDWNDVMPNGAAEWAVQNKAVGAMSPGTFTFATDPFMAWHPGPEVDPLWMRITLGDRELAPGENAPLEGGAGPYDGYAFGETEDYILTDYDQRLYDFGDAPDTAGTVGYPTLLANNGARHVLGSGLMLGATVDAEFDGRPTANADGDDLAGPAADDEDGVEFLTPLYPGREARVKVTLSQDALLSAWTDFDADQTWGAGEQVFADLPLMAGVHVLNFHVPAGAVYGDTYARFRVSTEPGLPPAGVAADGEVEDYRVYLEPEPTDVKWEQGPVPAQPDNVFYGWNEPSIYGGQVGYDHIAADDWVCTDGQPVTGARWWGSFLGWTEPALDAPDLVLPDSYHLAIWTDDPDGSGEGFSTPDTVVWEYMAADVSAEFVGWDYDPRNGSYEACFLFEADVPIEQWFWQDEADSAGIYWLSVAANYVTGLPEQHRFGWKTVRRDPASPAPDEAVAVVQPTMPALGQQFLEGEPLSRVNGMFEQWDLAFELKTAEPDPQATKWIQNPDLAPTGMDVYNSTYPMAPTMPSVVLADDFECTQPGTITEITVYGSWYHDTVPLHGPESVDFTLSLHDNDSVGGGTGVPGSLLWLGEYGPTEFDVAIVQEGLQEGWYNPVTDVYEFPGDTACWSYTFQVEPGEFTQLGTPDAPRTYWLDVQAAPTDPEAQFGWKTSPEFWNSPAAWAEGTEFLPLNWQFLGQPDAGALAFEIATTTWQPAVDPKWSQPPEPWMPYDAIHGWDELSVYGGPQVVADDWLCTTADPVTGVHWIGSFLDWRQPDLPQRMPDGFHLGIWTDDPGTEFSHPEQLLWEYTAWGQYEGYHALPMGWDWDPRMDEPIPERAFAFGVDLPREHWFHQDPGDNIYWLSVAAVYDGGMAEVEHPFGIKTRPRDPASPAPDDAVRLLDPTAPRLPGEEGGSTSTGAPVFPVPNGAYVSDGPVSFGDQEQATLHGFTMVKRGTDGTVDLPIDGGTTHVDSFFDVFVEIEIGGQGGGSADSFFDVFVEMEITDTGDNTYATEILSMAPIEGDGWILRLDPTQPATGSLSVFDEGGDYHVDSFFDVFVELSVDGGQTYMPAGDVLMPDLEIWSDHYVDGEPIYWPTPAESWDMVFVLTAADRTPPHVVDVFVRGTDWTPGFLADLEAAGLGDADYGYHIPVGSDPGYQYDPLAWGNLDQVTVVFDEDVTVTQHDLTVTGDSAYPVAGFAYDSAATAATWTLAGDLPADEITLAVTDAVLDASGNRLDGEWANGSDDYPSGDGLAGGAFLFDVNVLPGDADGNAKANARDYITYKRHCGDTGVGPAEGDFDGDGDVDRDDLAVLRSAWGESVTVPPPAPIAPPAPLQAREDGEKTDPVESSDPLADAPAAPLAVRELTATQGPEAALASFTPAPLVGRIAPPAEPVSLDRGLVVRRGEAVNRLVRDVWTRALAETVMPIYLPEIEAGTDDQIDTGAATLDNPLDVLALTDRIGLDVQGL